MCSGDCTATKHMPLCDHWICICTASLLPLYFHAQCTVLVAKDLNGDNTGVGSHVHMLRSAEPSSGVLMPGPQGVHVGSAPNVSFHWPSGHGAMMVGCGMYRPGGTTAAANRRTTEEGVISIANGSSAMYTTSCCGPLGNYITLVSTPGSCSRACSHACEHRSPA
jgi:hypothetical protein